MGTTLSLGSTLTLNNGVDIPRLGLGVFRSRPGRETRDAVRAALELGYRHVDTAAAYGNEADVGAALRETDVPRAEVFVTTKLWNSDMGYHSAHDAFRRSLARLGLEYVDLYLLHWPVPGRRLEAWRALEELQRDGLARAIGVSNFMVRHLEELLAHATVPPQVDQVELSPFLAQAELRKFCADHDVLVEAYSPLTRGVRLDDPALNRVARRLGRTPAQILLRWALEKDLVVLPKSVHADRIRENAALFDFALGPGDTAALDKLDEDFHVAWDPTEEL
jgi:diketogulonate reductase-like aldo/keto reductase